VTTGGRGGRRVLLLSASAGAGHMRAAEAVAAALAQRAPEAEVHHLDALSLTTSAFRRLYSRGYVDLVNRAPALVGWLYDRTDRAPPRGAGDKLRLALERLNAPELVRVLREWRPDLVVHTHFLPAAIAAREKRKARLQAPHAVVVTDYDVHRFWYVPHAERTFVAREEARIHLEALGARPETLRVTGIPIDPRFAERKDRARLRREHGLGPEPVVLILGGGFGLGPVEELVERVHAAAGGAQLVVVAGRNRDLRDRLTRRKLPGLRAIGFTEVMHDWMSLADLAITKPGGLTTAEATARGLPLVVAGAIPGQETRNAMMLFEAGAAISGDNPLTIGHRVAELLRTPRRLAAMRRAALRLARPAAALDIAEDVLALAR